MTRESDCTIFYLSSCVPCVMSEATVDDFLNDLGFKALEDIEKQDLFPVIGASFAE